MFSFHFEGFCSAELKLLVEDVLAKDYSKSICNTFYVEALPSSVFCWWKLNELLIICQGFLMDDLKF